MEYIKITEKEKIDARPEIPMFCMLYMWQFNREYCQYIGGLEKYDEWITTQFLKCIPYIQKEKIVDILKGRYEKPYKYFSKRFLKRRKDIIWNPHMEQVLLSGIIHTNSRFVDRSLFYYEIRDELFRRAQVCDTPSICKSSEFSISAKRVVEKNKLQCNYEYRDVDYSIFDEEHRIYKTIPAIYQDTEYETEDDKRRRIASWIGATYDLDISDWLFDEELSIETQLILFSMGYFKKSTVLTELGFIVAEYPAIEEELKCWELGQRKFPTNTIYGISAKLMNIISELEIDSIKKLEYINSSFVTKNTKLQNEIKNILNRMER